MRCGCFCCAVGHAAKNKKSEPFSFEKRFGSSLSGASSNTELFKNNRSTIYFWGRWIATCLYHIPMGSCIEKKQLPKTKRNAVSFNTIRRFMDSKGVEPSTFRMRTERSPMRTLKKPPKNRTFLCETAKKYRRNAGFQTSITFEKKLPFLLQCEKVTLQEGCASDAI